MTLHYFQIDKLEPEQEKRLRAVFKEPPPQEGGVSRRGCGVSGTEDGGRFTPAVVEQEASEHENVDDFIAGLMARV